MCRLTDFLLFRLRLRVPDSKIIETPANKPAVYAQLNANSDS